jgi:hypothetical protein
MAASAVITYFKALAYCAIKGVLFAHQAVVVNHALDKTI